MSRCVLSVAYGEKYERLGKIMLESFFRHNQGWSMEMVCGDAVEMPESVKIKYNSPFNRCEIGRWMAMRKLLDKYDEVLYCDNDIYWYNEYFHPNAGIVLSPHCITDKERYLARETLFYSGIYNAGIVYVKGDDGKRVCDFIIEQVGKNPEKFIWNNNYWSHLNGKIWIQDIQSYLPSIGLDCKIDNNPGNNIAEWNLKLGVRKIIKVDKKYLVECNGGLFLLTSIHYSNYSVPMLKNFGDAMKELSEEYVKITKGISP